MLWLLEAAEEDRNAGERLAISAWPAQRLFALQPDDGQRRLLSDGRPVVSEDGRLTALVP